MRSGFNQLIQVFLYCLGTVAVQRIKCFFFFDELFLHDVICYRTNKTLFGIKQQKQIKCHLLDIGGEMHPMQ